jgi:hypothetical protein
VVLVGLSAHGHVDLSACDAYLTDESGDPDFSEQDLDAALARPPEGARIA